MDDGWGRVALKIGGAVAVTLAGRWYITHEFEQVQSDLHSSAGKSAWSTVKPIDPADYAYPGPTFGGIAGVTGQGTSGHTDNNSRPRELDGRYMSGESRAQVAGWGEGQTLSDNAPVIDERQR